MWGDVVGMVVCLCAPVVGGVFCWCRSGESMKCVHECMWVELVDMVVICVCWG